MGNKKKGTKKGKHKNSDSTHSSIEKDVLDVLEDVSKESSNDVTKFIGGYIKRRRKNGNDKLIVVTLICAVIIVLILLFVYNLFFRNNVDDSHQETINNNATQKVEVNIGDNNSINTVDDSVAREVLSEDEKRIDNPDDVPEEISDENAILTNIDDYYPGWEVCPTSELVPYD